jgi:hypothetical protein
MAPLWLWDWVFNFENSVAKDSFRFRPPSKEQRHSRQPLRSTVQFLMNGLLSTESAEETAARQDEKEKAMKSDGADGQQGESEEKAAALIQVRGPRLEIPTIA